MGRPFKTELSLINKTYTWAKSVDLKISPDDMMELLAVPTFVIGSGGSYSACHLFAILQQTLGGFSKAMTPLELHYSSAAIRNSNVVFLSASGKNSDILFAYNTALKYDPLSVLGICMKKNTRLGFVSANHSISRILEFDTPAGKDGFLATNSLIAYFTILSRIFGHTHTIESFGTYELLQNKIKAFVDKLHQHFT
ncbi:MAG: hypothetical protein ABUL44_03610, partial [Flavobacterium sp.]